VKKKNTGGGTFDKNEQPVYFIASGPTQLEIAQEITDHLLVAVNELESPKAIEQFDKMLDTGAKVFLDSGIFNLTNRHMRAHGITMDEALALAPDEIDGFDKLWDNYCEIVTRFANRVWGFIELDQGGAINKRKTRARIEKETGLIPVPVYHPLNDGWDYFNELAKEYDRICCGNVVQANQATRKRLITTLYERQRQDHPDTWIHFLGFTPNEWVHAAPFYGSCDSSSWLVNVRWSRAHRSQGACKRVGGFVYGMRYKYGSDYTDDNGYERAIRFAGAQGGWFLEKSWKAYMNEREEVFG
jgi:hypothetical protein